MDETGFGAGVVTFDTGASVDETPYLESNRYGWMLDFLNPFLPVLG